MFILWCSLRWIKIQNRVEYELTYGWLVILQLQALRYDVSASTAV